MDKTKKTYAAPLLRSFSLELEGNGLLSGSDTIKATDENVDTSDKSSVFDFNDSNSWDEADE